MELAHTTRRGQSAATQGLVVDLQSILEALKAEGEEEGMTAEEIRASLGLSKPKATALIKQAVKDGVIAPGRVSRWEEWCQRHISYVVYRRVKK